MDVIKFIKEILMWYVWFGKKILPFIKYGGVIFLGLVVVLSFAQNLPAGRQVFPIPGNFKSLVVMSGSMEPKIHTGSVAIVKPSENIQTGDIITFADPRDPKNLITHRIVEIGENEVLKTKGDANQAEDNWEVRKDYIVGKFLFSVPFLGYAVDFAKRPPGFLLLILFPAILIIANEVWAIKRELVSPQTIKAKNTKSEVAAAIISAVLLTFAFSSGRTLAFLSDTETSSGNTISVGVWDSVEEGDVVINEVEYDSTQSGTDSIYEWFELYNNKSSPVTLSGWTITDNTATDTIPDVTLPAHGFAVVAATSSGFATNYPSFSGLIVYISDGVIGGGLGNSGDQLTLKDSTGAEIDFVAWENNVTGWDISAGAGESIARKTKGVDTDVVDDWEVLSTPNPGTNPHSDKPVEEIVEEKVEETGEVTEPELESEPEPEPESGSDADAIVFTAPEDPPEASESAKPAEPTEPEPPESSESAQPKDTDE